MAAGDEYAHCMFGKLDKELPERGAVVIVQYCKAGKRTPLAPIEGRRDAPYPAASTAELLLFGLTVLFEAVRGVRHDCMYRVFGALCHP